MQDVSTEPPANARSLNSALGIKLQSVEASHAEVAAAAGRWGLRRPSRDRALPAVHERIAPRWRRAYTRAIVLADLASGGAAAVLVWGATDWGTTNGRATAALVSFPLVTLALALGGVYQHRFLGHGIAEFRRLVTAGAFLLAACSTAAYAAGLDGVRPLVLLGMPVALALSLAAHVAARLVLHRLRARGRCQQRVVAIGLERSVAELVRTLGRGRHPEMNVVAACVSRSLAEDIDGVPVLGTPAEALAVLRASDADTVVLTAWSDVSTEELRRLSWDLEGSGVQLLVAPRLAEVAVPRLHVRTVAGQPLLDIAEPEFTGLRRVAKSGLDYSLALSALLLLAPVMLVIGLAVKLTSPGPMFFRQERVGRHGKTFRMTKFRSMYLDAEDRLAQLSHLNEQGGGPLFKMRDDPRITRVGRLIRRYSLDELPQLFDVLSGSMSLVGPRPPLPREVLQYEDDVRRRLRVTPGITGLWQVSGRSDLSWEESVRLDLSYVENWSLGLDLSILARTVAAVVGRDGAY